MKTMRCRDVKRMANGLIGLLRDLGAPGMSFPTIAAALFTLMQAGMNTCPHQGGHESNRGNTERDGE
jgi:hypothetical protein